MTKTIANDIVRTMAKTEFLQIRLDSELKASLEQLARARGVSMAALILMAITKEYPGLQRPSLTDVLANQG